MFTPEEYETALLYEFKSDIDIGELYNKLAPSYDKLMKKTGYADALKISEMLKKFGISNDSILMDFGCGTGLVADNLKSEPDLKGLKIWGVDLSLNMLIESSKKSLHENLHVVLVGNFENFK